MIKKAEDGLRISRLCNYGLTLALFICAVTVSEQGFWAGPVRVLSTQMCKLCWRVFLIMTNLCDNVAHPVVAIVSVWFCMLNKHSYTLATCYIDLISYCFILYSVQISLWSRLSKNIIIVVTFLRSWCKPLSLWWRRKRKEARGGLLSKSRLVRVHWQDFCTCERERRQSHCKLKWN